MALVVEQDLEEVLMGVEIRLGQDSEIVVAIVVVFEIVAGIVVVDGATDEKEVDE